MEQYADQPYGQYGQYNQYDQYSETSLNPQSAYTECQFCHQPTYHNPTYNQPSYPIVEPAAHASPVNNFTFMPSETVDNSAFMPSQAVDNFAFMHSQTVDNAGPAIPKGYYRSKDGQIMKRKSTKHKSYYGLHKVWVTEHEMKQIRVNYHLIPLKSFAPGSAAGMSIWVATQNGLRVHEVCKLVRVSNAEYAAVQDLRRTNGGRIPQPRQRSVEEQELNQRSDERFMHTQKMALNKAGSK